MRIRSPPRLISRLAGARWTVGIEPAVPRNRIDMSIAQELSRAIRTSRVQASATLVLLTRSTTFGRSLFARERLRSGSALGCARYLRASDQPDQLALRLAETRGP